MILELNSKGFPMAFLIITDRHPSEITMQLLSGNEFIVLSHLQRTYLRTFLLYVDELGLPQLLQEGYIHKYVAT